MISKANPHAKVAKINCPVCSTTRYMEFECVECCCRWLSKMDTETMKANAPVIKAVMGEEHLQLVRGAFRGYMARPTPQKNSGAARNAAKSAFRRPKI